MRTFPLAAAALLAAAVTGCSGSDTKAAPLAPSPSAPSPTTGPSGTADAAVHDLRALPGNRWSQSALALAVGDSVRVTDADSDVPHNFVVAKVGHSQTMNDGDVFTLKFPAAGTFQFVCTFHEAQGMKGTITVS